MFKSSPQTRGIAREGLDTTHGDGNFHGVGGGQGLRRGRRRRRRRMEDGVSGAEKLPSCSTRGNIHRRTAAARVCVEEGGGGGRGENFGSLTAWMWFCSGLSHHPWLSVAYIATLYLSRVVAPPGTNSTQLSRAVAAPGTDSTQLSRAEPPPGIDGVFCFSFSFLFLFSVFCFK